MLETKIKISGFCDEIHDDILVQFEAAKKLGIKYYDPRIVDGKNVTLLTDEELDRLCALMKEYGMTPTSLGTPIGKIKTTDDFEEHFEYFKRTVEVAKKVGTKYIRMFSFYLPEDEDFDSYTDWVVERLERMVKYAEEQGVVLLHENEKGIYGNVASRCKILFERIVSPAFRCAFDFSNFVECDQECSEAYEMLKPYIDHIHIKDNKGGTEVVPAGWGDGKIPEILADAYKNGYDGFVSLEPHLFTFDVPETAGEMTKQFEDVKAQRYAFAVEELVKVIENI